MNKFNLQFFYICTDYFPTPPNKKKKKIPSTKSKQKASEKEEQLHLFVHCTLLLSQPWSSSTVPYSVAQRTIPQTPSIRRRWSKRTSRRSTSPVSSSTTVLPLPAPPPSAAGTPTPRAATEDPWSESPSSSPSERSTTGAPPAWGPSSWCSWCSGK